MNKEFNLEETVNRLVELGKQAQDNMNNVAKAFEELCLMFEQDKSSEDDKKIQLKSMQFYPNYRSLDSGLSSWLHSKGKNTPFYFKTASSKDFGALTLEEAEQLRDFLTDRINYLKS